MRAEFQKFNGDWFKDCPRCKAHYAAYSLERLTEFFHRNNAKKDGLECHCKLCAKKIAKKKYERKRK